MGDKKFMLAALNEAKKAYSLGQIPIGAALVIDNILISVNSSTQVKEKTWFHHAENMLIKDNAKEIKYFRTQSKNIEIYTTMEPCLMCLGTAIHNRINKIVYACPDPIAGAKHLKPITDWYSKKWPIIEQGPFKQESYELFMKYAEENLDLFDGRMKIYRNLKERL